MIDSNGSNTRAGGLQGNIKLKNFGFDGSNLTADDLLYNDNHGNTALLTTDGLATSGPANWLNGTDRQLSDQGSKGGSAKVAFDMANFPNGWTGVTGDSFFENASHYNTNAIIFG